MRPIVYLVVVLGRVLFWLGGYATWSTSSLRVPPVEIFLDIQIPGCDGFGVIEGVGPAKMPRGRVRQHHAPQAGWRVFQARRRSD